MRVFAVPGGIPSRSATSTWVSPVKNASSTASRWSGVSFAHRLVHAIASDPQPRLVVNVITAPARSSGRRRPSRRDGRSPHAGRGRWPCGGPGRTATAPPSPSPGRTATESRQTATNTSWTTSWANRSARVTWYASEYSEAGISADRGPRTPPDRAPRCRPAVGLPRRAGHRGRRVPPSRPPCSVRSDRPARGRSTAPGTTAPPSDASAGPRERPSSVPRRVRRARDDRQDDADPGAVRRDGSRRGRCRRGAARAPGRSPARARSPAGARRIAAVEALEGAIDARRAGSPARRR